MSIYLTTKPQEKLEKKPLDWNPNPASNLLLKYYYYVVVICVISLVTDRQQVLSELLFRHEIKSSFSSSSDWRYHS